MIRTTIIKEPVFDQNFIDMLHKAVDNRNIDAFVYFCAKFWEDINKEGYDFENAIFDFTEPFWVELGGRKTTCFETESGKSNDKGDAMCVELTGLFKDALANWFDDFRHDTYRYHGILYRIGHTVEAGNSYYPYIKRVKVVDIEEKE